MLRNQKLTDFLLKSRINYKKVLNDSMVLKDDFLNKSLLIINSEIERNSKLISSNLRPMDYELAPNYQNKLDDNWSSLPILDTESQDLFKNTDLDKIDVDKKFQKEIQMRTELINASSTKRKRKATATKDEKEDADKPTKKPKITKEDAYIEETQASNYKSEVEADVDEVSELKEEEEAEEEAEAEEEEEEVDEQEEEQEEDEEDEEEDEEDEEEDEALDIMRSVTEKEDEEEGTDLDTDPGTDLGTDVDSEDE
ncbi:unnamed protein product [[Candida] boidinii]|nr:unnamed protein product [[Candida] boidinii]